MATPHGNASARYGMRVEVAANAPLRVPAGGRIEAALAPRDLMERLRQGGVVTGGPAPMTPKDRSRFLWKLDEAVNAAWRENPKTWRKPWSNAGRVNPPAAGPIHFVEIVLAALCGPRFVPLTGSGIVAEAPAPCRALTFPRRGRGE